MEKDAWVRNAVGRLSPVEKDLISGTGMKPSQQSLFIEDAIRLNARRQGRRDVLDVSFKEPVTRETHILGEGKHDLYRCSIEQDWQRNDVHLLCGGAAHGVGHRQNSEIGIFGAEKYFNSLERKATGKEDAAADQRARLGLSASSPHTDVQDSSSLHGNSAAASDLSLDSKTRFTRSKNHQTDKTIWSSLRSQESFRSDHKNRRITASFVRSKVGCKWSACSGLDAVETEDATVFSARCASSTADPECRSSGPQISASSPRVGSGSNGGKVRKYSIQEPVLSTTARLANFLNLRRFGAGRSTSSSWTSGSPRTPKAMSVLYLDEKRGPAAKMNNNKKSQDGLPSGPLGSSYSVATGGDSPSASSLKSDSPRSILSLFSLRTENSRRRAHQLFYSSENRIDNSLCRLSPLSLKSDSPKSEASRSQSSPGSRIQEEATIPKMLDISDRKFGVTMAETCSPKSIKTGKKESPRWIFGALFGKGESPRTSSLSSLQVKSSPRKLNRSLQEQFREPNILPIGSVKGRRNTSSVSATHFEKQSCKGRGELLQETVASVHDGLDATMGIVKSSCDYVDLPELRGQSISLERQRQSQNAGGLVGDYILDTRCVTDSEGTILDDSSFRWLQRSERKGKQQPRAAAVELHGASSALDQRRHSFTFPSLVSLPPSAIPLADVNDRSRGSKSASPSAPGSPARADDAFGSPFSVATCPSGDYRRRADLIQRLRLYTQERLSSLSVDVSSKSSKMIDQTETSLTLNVDDDDAEVIEGMANGSPDGVTGGVRESVAERTSSLTKTVGTADDYEYSDSSSDLFDLESFGGDGGGSEELPVFQQQFRREEDCVPDDGYCSAAPHAYYGDGVVPFALLSSTEPNSCVMPNAYINPKSCCASLPHVAATAVDDSNYLQWATSEEGRRQWKKKKVDTPISSISSPSASPTKHDIREEEEEEEEEEEMVLEREGEISESEEEGWK